MPTAHPLTKRPRTDSTEEVIVSEHLAELRSRVRLLTWISGLCWTFVVFFGGLLVAGTLDWLIHFDDSGTRLVVGLGLLGGSGWMFWQQLISPLCVPLSGRFLATRVERRFPGLKNRVISAVEFLEHRMDSKLGSAELQNAVIRQALDDLACIETSDVVETKSVRNVAVSGAVVCAIVAMVTLLNPIEVATSIKRLVLPFGSVPWPRAVELQLVRADLTPVIQGANQPILIARGETLEFYVQNTRGRLPERVWFEFRTEEDGPIIRESLRQTTLRDEKGRSHATAVINWVAVHGSLLFRATGGDDNVMPFYRVDVVPPPSIESLQVTVTPPRYSRSSVEVLPPGVGHIQGLLGTKVDVTARSDKPLKSAKLRIGEQAGIPLIIEENGRQFNAAFEIKDALASHYWFEMTDFQGFTDREPDRYELRGIADGVPEVSIEIPVTDVMLTADAELPIKVLAKDDLGLREIRIKYQVGDEERTRTIPLFDLTSKIEGEPVQSQDDPQTVSPPIGPQRHESEYLWKMADLHPEPGTRITFHAEATDDYDIGQPHVGKSVPRTITIVSREEKQKELAARVSDLLDDLKQAALLQQRARQQTQELQTQLDKVGELRPQDIDQLGRAELDQRQTTSRLTNPTDGVETQAQQLLDEFRGNQLNDTGTEQRLERLANELGRLEREELPDAEQSLTRAQKLAEKEPVGSSVAQKPSDPVGENSKQKSETKGAQPSTEQSLSDSKQTTQDQGSGDQKKEPDAKENKKENPRNDSPAIEKSLNTALAEAEAQQTRSLDTLQELQDSLAEWRDRRDVSRDLSSVIAEQESVQKDSSEIAQQTMTKSSAELTKQEKAEINKLAARQRKVAEQLDQFRKQLEQAAGSIEKNDPDSAEKFNEASQELSKQATASKLREAAEEIVDNKLGSAAQSQQKAIDELHDLERMMKRQPNEDTEQFLKQTQEAQQEFQQLREDQQQLADQAEELAQQPDSPEKQEQMRDLMEKQEELTERMAKAERKLERLRLRGPQEAAHRARKRLNEMMKHMQEADDAEEMQQAMDEALDNLEQVERELVLEKRIAQERLAFEQLEKIEDELKALRSRQETVIAETTRLDEAKSEQETLTRGQLKTLKELAETERSLQHMVEQMQQQMSSAEIFSLVLKRLGRSLKLAADRLGERETSAPTQVLENDAIRKIDSLLAVLKKEQKKNENPQQPANKPEELGQEPQEQEEKPEEVQPPGETVPQLAQLKLLKSLQEEYLERTELLNKFRDKDGKLPESMEAEKNELAREQIELADFARNMIAKFLQRQPDRTDDEHKAEETKPKSGLKDQSKEKVQDPRKLDP